MSSAAAEVTSYEPGTKISGIVEVISLHGQEVFLDLGGPATGYILKEELLDRDGNLSVKQGDTVEGVVTGTDFNGVKISRVLSRQSADMKAVKDALASGLPVEGKVTGTNKGGYDVQVGRVRAFCPFSQIDVVRPGDPESFVGQVHRFMVTEIRKGSAVLSRAALLAAERGEQAKVLWAELKVGARLTGRVRSIQKFGVFVDLGGVDGLVHVSQLSWDRVNDPAEFVQLGQEVEVIVTELDEKRNRVGLSMRQASADPFSTAVAGLAVGGRVKGKVARITNFGAFVTIAPGVDGLIHVTDMAHRRVRHPGDVVKVGDEVEVQVMEIDLERRRVGLSLKALGADPWLDATNTYPVGSSVKGTITGVRDFGVFVELENGITALLPGSESGLDHGKSLQQAFKVGAALEAKVLRVDTADRKMAITLREGGRSQSRHYEGRRDSGHRDRRRGGGGGSKGRVWLDSESQKSDEKDQAVGSLGEALLAALQNKDSDD